MKIHYLLCILPIMVYGSDPARFNPLSLREQTVQKMNRCNLSFQLVGEIVRQGKRIATARPYNFIYIHKGSCVVLDESSYTIIDVMKNSCVCLEEPKK